MGKPLNLDLQAVVCIDNDSYPASLELHKIYRVLPDADAAADGDLRVVDESGEDYLFPASAFAPIFISHEELAELLGGHPQIKLAILFGSQAGGSPSADSDIDLALLGEGPLPSGLKLHLMGAIGAKFGRPVDIIDLHSAGEPILGQVFQGKRLLGDDATYAKLLTRHLIDSADFLPLRERILAERRKAWIG